MPVPVDEFANEIAKALTEYTEPVREAIAEAVDEVAGECADELKQTSPVRTGAYAKSWRATKDRWDRSAVRRVVWNPKFYRLVHLLEKGHAKRGGGRVSAIPHVAPAEEKYVKKLADRAEEIVRKGG